MLRLESVRAVFDEFVLSADLSVRAGARVAVLGPSGAGKSTLLGLIAGFAAPDNGRVYVLNFASNAVSAISAELLAPNRQLSMDDLVDYRTAVLNAFSA